MTRAGLLLGALALLGCRDNVADPEGPAVQPPIVEGIVLSEVLVPGSRVELRGEGFLSGAAGRTAVRLQGLIAGRPVDEALTVSRIEARRLVLTVGSEFAALFAGREGHFDGHLEVSIAPADQPAEARARIPLIFDWAPSLQPALREVEGGLVAPGALLAVEGAGLIDAEEGDSQLLLSGRFVPERGPAIQIGGQPLALHDRLSRAEGRFYLRPGVLSLAPGRFEGTARLRTTDRAGETRETPPIALALQQVRPRVDGLHPDRAARGQIIALTGEGFLPNDPNAETATLVHAEGLFTPLGGEAGPVRLVLLPEARIDDTEVRLALRTVLGPDGPTGFGANPGRFVGRIHVELLAGFDRVTSPPREVVFTVAPMTQVVWLRYLPGFIEGLARFGLSGAEAEIRALILAVCHRDYAGLRMEFREARPIDWAEYVTVEIGGRDPNGLGLFGLDNSPETDEGNHRLDELLGGRNAQAEAAGSLPFGGIFVESFFTLSPTQPDAAPIADPRFDALFGPLSPALSPAARPHLPGEVPTGGRARIVEEAARALANLIGSTITHEVGHALGLARVAGDVHNLNDTDGGLMDRGSDRPFAERAAIDGVAPARFLEPNRSYLRALLGE